MTAITFIAQGAWLYAIFCITSVLLVGLPAYLAHTSKANLPVELELILLWFLVAYNTLGRLVALYGTPWFDKTLHLGNSGFIGLAARAYRRRVGLEQQTPTLRLKLHLRIGGIHS